MQNYPQISTVQSNYEARDTGGACNIAPGSTSAPVVAQQTPDEQEAGKLGITVDRLHKMRAYAKELRRKNPTMKPERLTRKVAEYFKVKLV